MFGFATEKGGWQRECPYPAYSELNIEGDVPILSFEILIEYLRYIETQEKIKEQISPLLSINFSPACNFIISLLLKSPQEEYISGSPKVYRIPEMQVVKLPKVLTYTDPNFPDMGNLYDVIAVGHGVYVGINYAHIAKTIRLALEAKRRNSALLIGFERDKYVERKRKADLYLRPWPLIITLSIFAHLANIYNLPLYTFVMPEIPIDDQVSDYEQVLNDHYNNFYKRIVIKYPGKCPLVLSALDPYREQKVTRMVSNGMQTYYFQWVQLPDYLSVSTQFLMAERSYGPRNLASEEWSGTKVFDSWAGPDLPEDYMDVISLLTELSRQM